MVDKKLVLLPCEIYHREFDAKLILAQNLASTYCFSSLIGYDKHFTLLSNYLKNCSLLEKSCSSIMWNARIKNVVNRCGEVIVSDEEGFNNIDESNSYAWSSRLDSQEASAINLYACWGKTDFQFFSRFNHLAARLKILGNCRSDLLGASGKKLYAELSSSLQMVFGPFVLCVDNFCVEHRDGSYSPPRYDKSEEENNKAQIEYAARMEDQANRRSHFARLIKQSALNNANLNYVIRPHPCADPRWWCEAFWDLRNVHVIYKYNVDPWLHAAKAVISMGCTTSIQSIVAGTPVIEIKLESSILSQNLGFAHNYTKLNVKNIEQLDRAITHSLNEPSNCFRNRAQIESDWKNSLTNSATSIFADEFYDIASTAAGQFDHNISTLNDYSLLRRKKPLVTNSTKWIQTPLARLYQLQKRVEDAFSFKPVTISKICDDLFLVSP